MQENPPGCPALRLAANAVKVRPKADLAFTAQPVHVVDVVDHRVDGAGPFSIRNVERS